MDILSPAGNYQKFIAGLDAGADGFYLGLEKFSARSSAGNFNSSDLHLAFLAAKIHNKKIYIAINTLLHENEIEQVVTLLSEIVAYQPAGIIIQDLALFKILREYFPALPIVASTQMSVHNLFGVKLLQESGFDQVVLARELSLEEIEFIKSNSNIKLEIFIHGAMCFSYSGQCLFSSMIGGRSGNRGQCAQICRKIFQIDKKNFGCLLSPQDIDGSNFVKLLAAIGVSTAKIEGRMRSPQYVYAAVQYYNALLKNAPQSEVETKKYSLNIAFDRGSSTGYFNGKNNQLVNPELSANHGLFIGKIKDLSTDQAVIDRKSGYQLKKGDGLAVKTAGRTFGFTLQQEPLNTADEIIITEQVGQFKNSSEVFVTSEAALSFLEVEQPKIKISINITSAGDILTVNLPQMQILFQLNLEKAKSEQDFNTFLFKKISNFKHTIFEFSDISVAVEAGLFIAYSQLREKLITTLDFYIADFSSAYQAVILTPKPVLIASKSAKKSLLPKMIFHINNIEQLEFAKQQNLSVCLDLEFYNKSKDRTIFADKQFNLLIPAMIKDQNYAFLANLPKNILPVASNLGEVNYFKQQGRGFSTSFHLNISNSHSAEFLFEQTVKEVQLSLEADLQHFNFRDNRNYSLRVFGEFPVMTTEYCLIKNNISCQDCTKNHYLTDEKNAHYPIKSNSYCQNTIFYHTPLFLGSDYNKLLKYPLKSWWINLSGLDLETCKDVASYFAKGLAGKNFEDKIVGRQFKRFVGRYLV